MHSPNHEIWVSSKTTWILKRQIVYQTLFKLNPFRLSRMVLK